MRAPMIGLVVAFTCALGIGGCSSSMQTAQPGKVESAPPLDAGYLQVRGPQLNGQTDWHYVDLLWQREINTHVWRMRTRDVLGELLQQPEVRKTNWFKNASANGKRPIELALVDILHARQVPGTALIAFWTDAPAADAQIISQNWAKVYLRRVQREIDDVALTKQKILFSERKRADDEASNLRDEIRRFEAEHPKLDADQQQNLSELRELYEAARDRARRLDAQLSETRIAAMSSPEALEIAPIQYEDLAEWQSFIAKNTEYYKK